MICSLVASLSYEKRCKGSKKIPNLRIKTRKLFARSTKMTIFADE